MTLPFRLTFVGGPQETTQQLHCRTHRVVGAVPFGSGQEHPRERDVLEFAQVCQVVLSRQAPLSSPGAGLGQLPLRHPHTRPQCGDRPHIRQESHSRTGALPRRGGRARRPGHLRPCASEPWRLATGMRSAAGPRARPDSLLITQVLPGGIEIVPFEEELAHAHVHVCRAAQDDRAMLRRTLEPPLVGAHRLLESTLRDPDVGQGDGAADDVRDVPGLSPG